MRYRLLVPAIALLSLSSETVAQTPNLYWSQTSLSSNQAACQSQALEALRSGTLYEVATGAQAGSGSNFATGSNANLRAVISCSRGDQSTASVIVAGSEGHRADAELLGEYLKQYMDGKRPDAPDLSSTEAPVQMNEWLTDTFCLGCDGSESEARYSGEIARPARSIRIRVYSGRVESGDGSIEVLMYGPTGQLVLTGETEHEDWAEWRVGVVDHGRYELVLRTLTQGGGAAGVRNEGEVQVLVR
jgi:hypothetical protein